MAITPMIVVEWFVPAAWYAANIATKIAMKRHTLATMISDLLLVNRRGRRMSLRIHRGRSRLRSAALHSCQTKPCSPFEHDEDQIRYQFLNRRRRSTRLIHGTTSLRNFSKQKTRRCMKTSDIWHLVSLDLTCTHV